MTISKSNTATIELLDRYFDTAFCAPEGIPKLRELILSLAMQGQLVRQNPDDKPARELLKDIEAEKQRLRKEGKIKKQKPLPDIKPDEIPYDIPDSWEWVRLGDIATKLTDGSHNPPQDNGKGFPMLSSRNINSEKIDFSNPSRYVNEENFIKEDKRTQIQPSDLLLTIVGSLGRTAVVPENSPKFVVQRSVAVIRSLINSHFLSKQLISSVCTNYYLEHGKGTAQKGIYLGKLSLMLIAIPPLEEQTRIVERIESLMEKCDRFQNLQQEREAKRLQIQLAVGHKLLNAPDKQTFNEAWQFMADNFDTLYSVKENVKELRKIILQLAVMGKLVPQDENDRSARELLKDIETEKQRLIKEGKIKQQKPLLDITIDEIPYDIPDTWEWVRIRNICHDLGQKKPDTTFTYIDVGSIDNKKGYITDSVQILDQNQAPSRARKLVKQGTVIYSTVRPYLLNIAIVTKNYKHQPIASTAFAILNPYIGINNYFIYYYLKSSCFVKYVEDQMKGVAYPAINDSNFYRGLFPLPPFEEQKRIVEKVDKMMKLCDELEEKITAQTDTQTRLLHSTIAQIST